MKINLSSRSQSLKVSIGIATGIGFFIIALLLAIISSLWHRNSSLSSAENHLNAFSEHLASEIKAYNEVGMDVARTLSQTLGATKKSGNSLALSRDEVNAILKQILQENPQFFNVFTIWEANAFDNSDIQYIGKKGHDYTGRFIPNWIRTKEDKLQLLPAESFDIPGIGDYYLIPKKTKKESIINPYLYPVNDKDVLLTSYVCPIVTNEKFNGVVGIGSTLNWIQNMLSEIELDIKDERVIILAHDGTICGVTGKPELTGKSLNILFPDNYETLLQYIQSGMPIQETFNDRLYIGTPVYTGKSTTPWYVYVSVPQSYITSEATVKFWFLILIALGLLTILEFLLIRFIIRITAPLENLANAAEEVANGKLHKNKIKTATTEIKLVNQSFNKLTASLKEITEVTEAISQGDFSKKLHEKNEEDVLSISINKMIDNLKHVQQEAEKQKIEENRRNWITEGLAKFSDILRQRSDNLTDMAYEIISNLVKYLEINQGGIFIYNDDDQNDIHLELLASYAYNRRKFIDKKIMIGEGLVGACALEKKTNYMTNIPDEYIRITSGLGKANPNVLLLVPMKLEERIFGILELASFEPIEKHKINFVEQVGESISSTLNSVKTAIRTNRLLEESKQQAEELASQEEEMRQNLEELQATQEDAHRKEREMEGLLSAIDHTTIRAEYNTDGMLQTANDRFLEVMEYEIDEILGKSIKIFIPHNEINQFNTIWNDLLAGNSYERTVQRKTKTGATKWLLLSYTPIKDAKGDVEKILHLSYDITEQKASEIETRKLAEKLQRNEQLLVQKQKEMEQTNHKLLTNEKVLQKALSKAKTQGTELKEKTKALQQSKKEMEINMEEMRAIQESMAEKDAELSGQMDAINETNTMVEFNLDGTILSANHIFCSLTKYKEHELKGKPHSVLVSGEDKNSEAYRQFWERLKTGEAISGEFKQVTKDGETIYLKGTYNPIFNKDNQVVKILKLAFDITDTKMQQAMLQSQNEELQSREEELRQNMEELAATQERMHEQQKELEEANKKMKSNETILIKAIEKAKEKENEINEIRQSEKQRIEQQLKVRNEMMLKKVQEFKDNEEKLQKRIKELEQKINELHK